VYSISLEPQTCQCVTTVPCAIALYLSVLSFNCFSIEEAIARACDNLLRREKMGGVPRLAKIFLAETAGTLLLVLFPIGANIQILGNEVKLN